MSVFSWIQKHRLEFVLILLLLLLTLFLRFYKLPEYMSFLGDEGRDGLVVKKILIEHDFPLLGAPTSVGNMYLGPIYYYMMSVPMALFWMNPVAASGMVALIGTGTVLLIYYLARKWFGVTAALVSAFFYSISPVNIIYSRSSWNPNPAPFFALLSMFGLFKAHESGNFRWFILTGASLAFILQMHYLSLILIPILGILWLNELRIYIKNPNRRKYFVSSTILSILVFLFLMSPLVIFDFKYNFMNYRAFTTLLTSNDSSVGVGSGNNIFNIYFNLLIGRYLGGQVLWVSMVLGIMILVPLFWALIKKYRGTEVSWPYLGLGIWLVVGLVGLTLYKKNIYDHYLGFLNPVIYLLLGAFVQIVWIVKKPKYRLLLISLLAIFLVYVAYLNILNNPLLKPPLNQLSRTQDVAKYIIAESDNKPFNFALIAAQNYDAAYQFYLDNYDHTPGQLPFTKTDQLFVVCEDIVCQPIMHNKFEISAFGPAQVVWERDFRGVRIFKLVPEK